MKLFKFFTFFLFKGSGALLTFSYIFLSNKILSPTEYGIFALLITFINLGGAILSFGIPTYIFNIMSSKSSLRQFNEKLKHILVIVFLISIVFLIFATLFSDFISLWFFKDSEYGFVISLLGLLIFFVILNRIFSTYFIAVKKPYISTIGDNFLFPFFITFYLFTSLGIKNFNYDMFLQFTLFLIPLISVFYLIFIKINFSLLKIKTTIKKYKQILKPCAQLTLVSASGILLISSDIIILGLLAEPASVANYHIATKIAFVIGLVSISSMSFYYGKSLQLFRKNSIHSLRKQICKVNFYSLIASLFILIFIALTYNQLIKILFYDIDTTILKSLIFVLCFGQLINLIFGYQGSLLIITKYRSTVSYIFVFTLFFNIITSILAFYAIGVLGVALVTMLSTLLRELLLSYFFKKYYGFHPLSYFKFLLNYKNIVVLLK